MLTVLIMLKIVQNSTFYSNYLAYLHLGTIVMWISDPYFVKNDGHAKALLKIAKNYQYYYYLANSNLGMWISDPYRVEMTAARNLCLQFSNTWFLGKMKVIAVFKH